MVYSVSAACPPFNQCSLSPHGFTETKVAIAQQQCHPTGAIDALTLLDKYIAPGCVLLFDDLINYPNYRDHEILALWEWLQNTGRKLEVRCLTRLDIILFACLNGREVFIRVALCILVACCLHHLLLAINL